MIPSDSYNEENLLDRVESALNLNDLQKAAEIIARYKHEKGEDIPALKKLHEKIVSAQNKLEKIDALYQAGAHALDNKNPEKALSYFKKVVDLVPDHAPARAGIQGARRYKEWREKVDALLAQAHRAKCDGDLQTAKERCDDVLKIAPNNVAAHGFLQEITHWISKRKRARIMMRQGEHLFLEKKYKEAIRVWEQISDIDPSFDDGYQLIAKAKYEIQRMKANEQGKKLLLEAQHALNNQDFEYTLKLLESFPEDSEYSIDAKVIRRKAIYGIEFLRVQKQWEEKVRLAMVQQNLPEVQKVYHIILELNPLAPIIEEIRKFLDEKKFEY